MRGGGFWEGIWAFFFWICTCYYLRRNANFTRAMGVSYVPISGEVASTWKCSHKCVLFVVCKWEMSLGGRPPREDLKLWTRKPRNWVLKPETDSWCRRLWSKPGLFPQKIWSWQDVKTQDPRANLVLSLSLSLREWNNTTQQPFFCRRYIYSQKAILKNFRAKNQEVFEIFSCQNSTRT